MSVISNETREPNIGDVTVEDLDQVERVLIDVSARTPVLAFYSSAIFWLLIQTLLSTICALKVRWPEFLSDCPLMTYGRLVPAQNNIMVYGWASMAGIGTAIWILSRLCRVTLPRPGLLILGSIVWNVGVAVGVIGILFGDSRGFELLEFSQGAMVLLFVAYSLLGVWGFVIFQKRRPGHIYISVNYFIAALFWFPWLVGVASVMLGKHSGIQGVTQAIVGAWYAQGVLGLWLGALGLGTIYYLIPKVIGRPIHSYYLASFGFWTFAVFSVWTGMQRLNGGPVPAWIVTTSVVAALMMLIPVTTVTVNYLFTMRGSFNMVHESPTLCFVFFGALAYTFANLIFLLGSFRSVSAITQFTWFGVAENQLFTSAFFSMVMFGSMYYIVPRLVGCEWLSGNFIKIHYWGAGYGFGLSIVMLILGGLAQGGAQSVVRLNDPLTPHADFLLSISAMMPFMFGRIIGQFLLCIAQFTFALHFILMLLRFGRPSGSEVTLFSHNHGGAHS